MRSRRSFLQLAAGALAIAPLRALAAPAGALEVPRMITRPIPRTQEQLPVIGLGTWQAFDVDAAGQAPLVDVMRQFLAAGGRVIDSSPMYGRSEAVVGDVVDQLAPERVARPFFATKVWTRGARAGVAQMAESRRRLRTTCIDLMQIHNLLDWQTHLPALRDMKQSGEIRYIGVTHYAHRELSQIERMMKTETLDFIQIPYNLADRTVEARVLPAARDTGTAVLVMRPFEEGALFRHVRGRPLPELAAELDCTSWAQLFLKFIVSHPAVTCPIPATANPKHLADNMKAGVGRLPDAAQRRALIAAFEA